MTKYVYLFKEGNANMRELLGGKGANLAEMTNLGLPVPQGFTVTTEACTRYYTDAQFYLRQPSIFPQKRKIPLFLNHFNSTCTIFRSNFNNILSVYQIRYI